MRDKTDGETTQAALPIVGAFAAIAAAGAAVATGVNMAKTNALKTQELQRAEIQCPLCLKRVVPTRIIVEQKSTWLSKWNFLSNVEANYKGCPSCKGAISRCNSNVCKGVVTESTLECKFDPTSSKTGYQFVQRCKVCRTFALD